MFDTAEEANQKLRHSVVLLSKSPVFIQVAEGSKKSVTLIFSELGKKDIMKRCIWESDWNFRDLGSRLGYTNIDLGNGSYKEACYLSRMPVRQCSSTQGISQRNLYIPPLKGSSRLSLGPQQLVWQNVWNTGPFKDMFNGVYPDLPDIKKEFEKSPWLISKAFNKDFAIRRADVGPFYLQYKGRDVAHSDDLHSWKVAKQFLYLRESLEYTNLKVS